MGAVRRFVWENSLSLAFGLLFVAAVVAQAVAGWHQFNAEQVAEGLGTIGLGSYVASADFAVDVAENWQSEFLQFWLYLTATVWLVQRGSPESKELDKVGQESDEDQLVGEHARPDSPSWARGGWRTRVYSSSLAIVMGVIFFASWAVQSIAGWAAYNETRLQRMQDPVDWRSYLVDADFWNRTLQNWQSEFLAIGTMAVLAIYLRQRGSSQSKPVGEPTAPPVSTAETPVSASAGDVPRVVPVGVPVADRSIELADDVLGTSVLGLLAAGLDGRLAGVEVLRQVAVALDLVLPSAVDVVGLDVALRHGSAPLVGCPTGTQRRWPGTCPIGWSG